MSNAVAIATYRVFFRDKRFQDEELTISEDQYQGIREDLVNARFVEINGSAYNTADILRVVKTVRKPEHDLYWVKLDGRIFRTEAEYEAWQRGETE